MKDGVKSSQVLRVIVTLICVVACAILCLGLSSCGDDSKKTIEDDSKKTIEDAKAKIADFDMEAAYKELKPLAGNQEADDLMKKIDSMCYDDTFIVRVENIVSTAPVSSKIDKTNPKYLVIGSEYRNASALDTAFSEYYKYLGQHFTTSNAGGQTTEYKNKDMLNGQTYIFEDSNGNEIKLTAITVLGTPYLNLALSRNADWRAGV